jgi:hypothetical protein
MMCTVQSVIWLAMNSGSTSACRSQPGSRWDGWIAEVRFDGFEFILAASSPLQIPAIPVRHFVVGHGSHRTSASSILALGAN